MTKTKDDLRLTDQWTDVTAERAGTASVPLMLHAVDGGTVWLVFGGAAQPGATKRGLPLDRFDSMNNISADHIWARAAYGSAVLGVVVL